MSGKLDENTIDSLLNEGRKALGDVTFDSKSRDILVKCNLAASFSTSEITKEMDQYLKVVIAPTITRLSQLTDYSRNSLLQAMEQNVLLELCEDPIYKTDEIEKSGTAILSSENPAAQQEVEFWFKNLVGEEEVLSDTRIDKTVIEQILAIIGAKVDSVGLSFHDTETNEKTLLDIGVLRYPDIDHPYFKMYRITLNVWRKSERLVTNGIFGEFQFAKFKVRDGVIDQLSNSIF